MSGSKDVEEWAKIFMPTDSDLMAELYADGMSYAEIAEKFEVKPNDVSRMISSYMPNLEEMEKFKRRYVRRIINSRPKRH